MMRIFGWLAQFRTMFVTAAVLTAITLIPSHGFAKDLQAQLEKAQTLLVSGQPNAAYEALDALVEDFWANAPMVARNATFVSEVSGYGLYKERDASFKADEPQIVYLEPLGFGYGLDADKALTAGWMVDYTLTDESGLVLLQQDSFINLDIPLKHRNREVHLTLTVNVEGLKSGSYVSHYRLKDKNSEKQTDFSLPFEIVQ